MHTGIAFSDGPSWAELRRFSMSHLKKLGYGGTLMEELTNEEIGNFIDWLQTVANSPVKVHRLFTISIANIIWAMLAGKRYSSKNNGHLRLILVPFFSWKKVKYTINFHKQIPSDRQRIQKDLRHDGRTLSTIGRIWRNSTTVSISQTYSTRCIRL